MELNNLIKNVIEDLKNGSVKNDRLVSFVDYKNKYAILKPAITIKIELTKGVVAKVDITDYFMEELK